MTKHIGWDIEIAKDFPEGAGDWIEYAPLGITCGAASDGEPPAHLFASRNYDNSYAPVGMLQYQAAEMVYALEDYVERGYQIVTWNGLAFDFHVLAIESGLWGECVELAMNHVDMMFHVVCQKGFGVGLDAVAKTMGVEGKIEGMTGALAPQMWRDGEYEKVLEYVAQDARSTVLVANACDRLNQMRWTTRKGNESSMRLPGGWMTVTEALELPEPDTSWMDDPSIWDRERFLEWTKPHE